MSKELEALKRIETVFSLNKDGKPNAYKEYTNSIYPYYQDFNLVEQALLKSQDDKRFIDLILNKPQLLGVFAYDGIHTWEEFEDTYSDGDKEYINTTKEEFEYMRNQLIKRGKIDV